MHACNTRRELPWPQDRVAQEEAVLSRGIQRHHWPLFVLECSIVSRHGAGVPSSGWRASLAWIRHWNNDNEFDKQSFFHQSVRSFSEKLGAWFQRVSDTLSLAFKIVTASTQNDLIVVTSRITNGTLLFRTLTSLCWSCRRISALCSSAFLDLHIARGNPWCERGWVTFRPCCSYLTKLFQELIVIELKE